VTLPSPTGRQWPFYSTEAINRVARLLAAGQSYSSNRNEAVDRVEQRFTELHRPGGRGLFCGSGSAALLAGYFGLALDPGAEVLVPTNTFRATATPLLLLNLRPVMCDSDERTGTIDLDDAARRITPRTQAIAVTHLWGHPVDLVRLRRFADRHGLAVVEDCSHAHGAHWRGVPVGSVGDVAAFSLGTKKMVSGGGAGILLTSDQSILERAALLGHPKPVVTGIVESKELAPYAGAGFGANLRGNPIAAELVHDHLDRLPETLRIKNRNTELLFAELAKHLPALVPPDRAPEFDHGAWYAVRARWTDPEVPASSVIAALHAEGVPVERQGRPLHHHRVFADPAPLKPLPLHSAPTCAPEHFPASEAIYEHTIGWDTRELYEPADELIGQWSRAFAAVAERLRLRSSALPK
jgi:perosamine synthetase